MHCYHVQRILVDEVGCLLKELQDLLERRGVVMLHMQGFHSPIEVRVIILSLRAQVEDLVSVRMERLKEALDFLHRIPVRRLHALGRHRHCDALRSHEAKVQVEAVTLVSVPIGLDHFPNLLENFDKTEKSHHTGSCHYCGYVVLRHVRDDQDEDKDRRDDDHKVDYIQHPIKYHPPEAIQPDQRFESEHEEDGPCHNVQRVFRSLVVVWYIINDFVNGQREVEQDQQENHDFRPGCLDPFLSHSLHPADLPHAISLVLLGLDSTRRHAFFPVHPCDVSELARVLILHGWQFLLH
mmetsp:Transcript_1736/g.3534  ORF Transcript_1736/g.3534 Transcript_1736/m.3534 type:complete len:295 (+) Transcript_1736:3246-4130(+)